MENNEIIKQLENLLIISDKSEKEELSSYLKLLSEKATDKTSESGLNIRSVTITEGKFCPDCGKRKNMKGDGTLELLCECRLGQY